MGVSGCLMMVERQKYKAKFTSKLPNGDFLGLTVWPGKSDPNAEVLTIQIRHQEALAGKPFTEWQSIGPLMVDTLYCRSELQLRNPRRRSMLATTNRASRSSKDARKKPSGL